MFIPVRIDNGNDVKVQVLPEPPDLFLLTVDQTIDEIEASGNAYPFSGGKE